MLSQMKQLLSILPKRESKSVFAHFHKYDDRLQASNGILTIDTHFPYFDGLEFTVPALQFYKAMKVANADIQITDKMLIKKDKFQAWLPLLPNSIYPKSNPSEYPLQFSNNLLQTLQVLSPFIGDNPNIKWEHSILFTSEFAYATNNVVFVRTPASAEYDTAIPEPAIKQLLKLNIEPVRVTRDEHSITFDLGDTWIKSKLITQQWPTALDLIKPTDNLTEVPTTLLKDIKQLLPFVQDIKYPVLRLDTDGIHANIKQQDLDASIGEDSYSFSLFHATTLTLIAEFGKQINLSAYPKPCYFQGKNIDGMVVGIRVN